MNKQTTKPAGLTETHLRFLDNLQASAETNMMGAGPYLQTRFGLDRAEAKSFVLYWMNLKESGERP
jgi:hypothetical protein